VPYFLDGNNLIGLARKTNRPGEEDRAALLSEISERLRGTRSSVRVFFDGGGGRGVSLGNLTVSDGGGSADEAIIGELRASKSPVQITVVTADRGLIARVRDAGGKTMTPADFWSRFGSKPAADPKRTGDRVDVEEWLDYFADPENRRK